MERNWQIIYGDFVPRAIEHAQIETKLWILYWQFLETPIANINSPPINHLVYGMYCTMYINENTSLGLVQLVPGVNLVFK